MCHNEWHSSTVLSFITLLGKRSTAIHCEGLCTGTVKTKKCKTLNWCCRIVQMFISFQRLLSAHNELVSDGIYTTEGLNEEGTNARPPLWIDDVYVTGILAQVAGVRHVDISQVKSQDHYLCAVLYCCMPRNNFVSDLQR